MQRIERFGISMNNTNNAFNNKKTKNIETLDSSHTNTPDVTLPDCPADANSYATGSISECACPAGKVLESTTGNGTFTKNLCSTNGAMPIVDSEGNLKCESGRIIKGGANKQYWCANATPSSN